MSTQQRSTQQRGYGIEERGRWGTEQRGLSTASEGTRRDSNHFRSLSPFGVYANVTTTSGRGRAFTPDQCRQLDARPARTIVIANSFWANGGLSADEELWQIKDLYVNDNELQ